MQIHDPIYGVFSLSKSATQLCFTPEVRRLSQIRLLNTLSPSLTTLGELRRFSHTLGVLYLAEQNEVLRSSPHKDAFMASVLLHDIGTPPFGHLFEYHLKDRFSWSHEDVIARILAGTHVRENKAHQIFGNQAIAFKSTLQKLDIDLEVVREIVSGTHPLSKLLFGTLDFDNLDNVARMNWALGQLQPKEPTLVIARNLSVGPAGELILSACHLEAVESWLRLRRAAYQVIVFDAPTVSAQAVLSKAIAIALEDGSLLDEDWSLTDEELIRILLKVRSTKKAISTQYLGRLPDRAFVLQLSGTIADLGYASRKHFQATLESELKSSLGASAIVYVFIDKGTFSKSVTMMDPESRTEWCVGENSQSVVIQAFAPSTVLTYRKCSQALQKVMDCLAISGKFIMKQEIGQRTDGIHAQQELKIPS